MSSHTETRRVLAALRRKIESRVECASAKARTMRGIPNEIAAQNGIVDGLQQALDLVNGEITRIDKAAP